MALELKSKPKTKNKVNAAAPSKKTMNFSRHVSSFDLRKMAPYLIVIVIVLALFAKFGFIDQLSKKADAYAQLADIQSQQEMLDLKLKDYPELEKQYGRYSYGWMSEDEVSLVDRMEIYSLIESKIMDAAVIEDFAINGNVITMNIRGITLIQASAVVKDLESTPMVDSAYVYSAEAENAEQAEMFMTVNLVKEAK